MKEIRITKLTPKATLPTRGSVEAAGYDLYAVADGNITIEPHKTELIHTGLSIEIPDGYFGGIYARSGIALKQGLRPANCTGVIDSDYRGEIMVALHNDTDYPKTVEDGMRIAQLIIQGYVPVKFIISDEELSKTERGNGGFGHSGIK